jgi:hypothetical protein
VAEHPRLILVSCGAAKLSHRAPAGHMYVGGFHRSCRMAADALATNPNDKVMILSGLHGLLRLDDEIDPYESRISVVTRFRVQALATDYGLLGHTVTVLAGQRYVDEAAHTWPDLRAPLRGSAGIGEMRARLAAIRRSGSDDPRHW